MGLLGPTLDKGWAEKRWKRWRPTISACWQDDLLIDKYELLYPGEYDDLRKVIEKDINQVSPQTKVQSHELNLQDPWDFEEVFSKLYEFSVNYKFDTGKNNYFINITTGTHVAQICLFLLTESNYLPGKLLQLGMGEEDKVKGTHRVIDLELKNYDPLVSRFHKESQISQGFLKKGIQTRNEDFNDLIAKIEKVSLASSEPLLLSGASGTGKTALARKIFELKKSKHKIKGTFVEINCATLRGDNAMSTLFGHKKGAFTGALSHREGVLKEADGGLLFLDEIGELGLDEQAMLLKAIEDKTFRPMGADKESKSDFQLIAGTNRDLQQSVKEGLFREDLLARINLWSFKLPSLNDRREDIEPNIDFEIEKFSVKKRKKIIFNKEAKKEFLKFAKSKKANWNANFRDLNAAIVRMSTLAERGKITNELVQDEIKYLSQTWKKESDQSILADFVSREVLEELDTFEKIQLEGVLSVCVNCKSLADAGKKLFERSREKRSTKNDSDRLKKYLNKYGISTSNVFKNGLIQ